MPGSTDQEIVMSGSANEQLTSSTGNDLTDHRMHQYVNRPEGEMDMMVGFFLMNGFCVSFFLLFGLCVIFSCLRKRPSFFQKKKHSDTEPVLPNSEDSFKPRLKSIVSQVVNSNKVTTKITVDEEILKNELNLDECALEKQVSMHSVEMKSLPTIQKPTYDDARRCSNSVSQENSAMIRYNLLGPLSFDDLYYM